LPYLSAHILACEQRAAEQPQRLIVSPEVGVPNTALQSDMRNRTSEMAAFALSVQFAGNRCFARTKDRLSAGRVQVHERKQGAWARPFQVSGLGRQRTDAPDCSEN
jgi:hypothetical protein